MTSLTPRRRRQLQDIADGRTPKMTRVELAGLIWDDLIVWVRTSVLEGDSYFTKGHYELTEAGLARLKESEK